MVEFGGKLILWHGYKAFRYWNLQGFFIWFSHKKCQPKEYVAICFLNASSVIFRVNEGSHVKVRQCNSEALKATLVGVGKMFQRGGYIKRALNPRPVACKALKSHSEFKTNKKVGNKLLISAISDACLRSVTACDPC